MNSLLVSLLEAMVSHSVIWPIIIPISTSLLCFMIPRRAASIGLAGAVATFFCVVMLLYSVNTFGSTPYKLGGWGAPLGIVLQADRLSLLFMLMTAVISLCIGFYARHYFHNTTHSLTTVIEAEADAVDRHVTDSEHDSKSPDESPALESYWPAWLLLWAGINALYVSTDIFNLYVALELVGISAVALVNVKPSIESLNSSLRYLLVSLLGSSFYLLGVVIVYNQYGILDLTLLGEQFQLDQPTGLAILCMVLGLAFKSAIFPFHFWLPPAHGSATAPVSALLSAVVVKSTFYLLLRLWLELFNALEGDGIATLNNLLAAMGACAVVWGSLQALFQERLKLLIAYSTVAQIGYFFMGFSLGEGWKGSLVMAISHGFAKSAMFLAAGNILYFMRHDRIKELDQVAKHLPVTLAAFSMAGVSIMGLPPSGGFAGKWIMLHHAIDKSYWLVAITLLLGSVLAGAYVFKAIGYAFGQTDTRPIYQARIPRMMEWSALFLALVSILMGLLTMPLLDWLDADTLGQAQSTVPLLEDIWHGE